MQISFTRVSKNLFKFIQIVRNYIQAAHNHRYKMNTAYFRYKNETEKEFQITFRYINLDYGIDRTFNFSRYITENIGTCMERIKTNVEKEFLKKLKKSNKTSKKNASAAVAAMTGTAQMAMEPPHMVIELYQNDAKVEEGCFKDVLVINGDNNLKLKVIDTDFCVVLNSPWVTQITLPSSILAGFIVYPAKLELQFAEKNECDFKWFRGLPAKSKNDVDIEWAQVASEFTYVTSTSDIDYKLKVSCIPKNKTNVGPAGEFISKCAVQAGPGLCPFESRHVFTTNKLKGDKFRVISYNILADLYCDSDFARTNLFGYCPPYALNIDYRKQLFTKEIIGYNADLICLQEVDGKIFDLDLEIVLNSRGLSGNFKMKGTSGEGLATFYNSSRFDFILHEGINIGENIETFPAFAKLYNKIKINKRLTTRIVERATAVQVTVLKPVDINVHRTLVIANTHLYFHPDADHIRLLQIGFSMLYVQHIVDNLKIDNNSLSIIFCGDFNSVPECGIYKLFTKKSVDENFIDWRSNAEEAVKGVTLSQPYDMESACGCPQYTNYTVGFTECIDYIFYQTNNLRVDQVIPMPSEEELTTHAAIPSVVFPSDHIALVADLQWK